MTRGLTDVRTRDGVILSVVVDFADKSRVSVDSSFAIELDGVRAPRRVPQLVYDFHVLFAHGIALVVLGLFFAVGEVAGC